MIKITLVLKRIVTFFSGVLQGWLLILMMCLIMVDVISRYLLNNPISIGEEYGAYMLVAITCMGLAYSWQEGSHVRIELLVNRLPQAPRQWLRLITVFMAFVFSVFMIIASYQLVSLSFLFGTRSGSWTGTPIAWPQITLVIGSVLLFFQLIIEVIKAVSAVRLRKGGKS
jgi:TRAP-type C4-dicarboxylate transport system permease small subunit